MSESASSEGDGGSVAGHLFVVNGRLERIRCDAVIVPTDSAFTVESYWNPLFPEERPTRPAAWPASFGRDGAGGPQWFISLFPGTALVAERLNDVLDELITEIAGVLAAEDEEGGPHRPGARPVPLIALPVLGLQGGGQGDWQGRVVRDLVAGLDRIAATRSVDIALVTPHRSVCGALQHLRRNLDTVDRNLDADAARTARELGRLTRDGRLALFLGAGVSIGAGLPSWRDLIDELWEAAGLPPHILSSLDGNPLDQAELVERRLGRDLGPTVAAIITRRRHGSLAHALLAGIGCDEVVTTNYDELYENAAEDAWGARPQRLGTDQGAGRQWILKMHGDVSDHSSIVLSRRSFVRYDASARPAGAVLQTVLMTRHLLVVGASLADDNVIRLALEVDEYMPAGHRFGTFVDVSEDEARAAIWEHRFTWLRCPGTTTAERVRRMEILLDAICMWAATDSTWLLDRRFHDLLSKDGAELASEARDFRSRLATAPDPMLAPLRAALDGFGRAPG